MEVIPYSPRTLDLAKSLAAMHLRTAPTNRRPWGSAHDMHVLSKVAEWMVCDSLALPRDERPENMRLVDVLYGGVLLGVRYRSRPDGDLMSPQDQAVHVDWQVLVVPAGERRMGIVGAASRQQLLDAPVKSFGYRPTRVVEQSLLRPWEDLRDELLTCARLGRRTIPDSVRQGGA